MIRATTIGVLKNYRYGLNNSFTKQNDARTTVLTHRNFNSFAEDPAAAARAFQLRRARMTAESQYAVADTSYRRFQTAWATLDTVVKKVDNVRENSCSEAALKALNEPTGGGYEARKALGKELDELADTLAQVMNDKYADNFLFSGADGQTVPFSWGKNGELLYRGIPVDAAVPEVEMAKNAAGVVTDKFAELTLNDMGEYVKTGGTVHYLVSGKTSLEKADPDAANDPTKVPTNALMMDDPANPGTKIPVRFDENGNQSDTGDYFLTVSKDGLISKDDYELEEKNAEKLRYLSEDEKLYMDIGLGNKEDKNNQLISSSAFDSTLQGINFLGYGKDADGDPRNIVTLVKQMADICNNSDEGRLPDEKYNELFRLAGKFQKAASNLHDAHVDMDARSSKLKNNLDLLEQNQDTLVEQYAEIEDVDDADAISAFLWASYSYNAALRVGNSVLSQSLMDYMQ